METSNHIRLKFSEYMVINLYNDKEIKVQASSEVMAINIARSIIGNGVNDNFTIYKI